MHLLYVNDHLNKEKRGEGKEGKEMGEERGREKKNVKYRISPTPSTQSSGEHPLIKDWMITSSNIYKWF